MIGDQAEKEEAKVVDSMEIKFRYPGIFFFVPKGRRRSRREGLGVGWREPDRPPATNGEKLEKEGSPGATSWVTSRPVVR